MSLRRTPREIKSPGGTKTTDAPLAQLAEQLTLNQWVPGSSPGGCTSEKPRLAGLAACEAGFLFCLRRAGDDDAVAGRIRAGAQTRLVMRSANASRPARDDF